MGQSFKKESYNFMQAQTRRNIKKGTLCIFFYTLLNFKKNSGPIDAKLQLKYTFSRCPYKNIGHRLSSFLVLLHILARGWNTYKQGTANEPPWVPKAMMQENNSLLAVSSLALPTSSMLTFPSAESSEQNTVPFTSPSPFFVARNLRNPSFLVPSGLTAQMSVVMDLPPLGRYNHTTNAATIAGQKLHSTMKRRMSKLLGLNSSEYDTPYQLEG